VGGDRDQEHRGRRRVHPGDRRPPVGHEITVELVLPTNERRFELPAVVRWVATDGMGVQFVNVDVDVLLELNDYFSTLTGTG